MALMINTNLYSINAAHNLSRSQSSLEISLQRLSSGLRINNAKDDAAGLAIASRMTAQIRGLDQAARNANDAISATQTAEGALRQSSDILQRIRELAVQSANETNTANDRASLQAEVAQLQQELNATANNTAFNGKKLLDGSFAGAIFQVGANANQTVSLSIASARATDIGNNAIVTDGSAADAVTAAAALPAANNVAAQTLTISGRSGTTTAAISAGATASQIADAVNAIAASTSVTATAATSATVTGIGAGTVSFGLTGTNSVAVNVTANISSATDLSGLVNAINNVASSTGITATSSGGTLSLASNGSNIGVSDFSNTGATTTATVTGGGSGAGVLLTTGANDSTVVGGTVSFSSSHAYSVNTSAAGTLLTALTNASSLSAVSAIDVGTQAGAAAALEVIDGALGAVNDQRGSLGAMQNRFENTIGNLQSSSENLSAARSRIQDADFAGETAALTRSQVLQQAGMAMLAQANAAPQGVLALLRG